jgi:hypothetical protein
MRPAESSANTTWTSKRHKVQKATSYPYSIFEEVLDVWFRCNSFMLQGDVIIVLIWLKLMPDSDDFFSLHGEVKITLMGKVQLGNVNKHI